MAQISGGTVYNLFERLGLPVKIYALKGKSDGIAYRKYEKKRPNTQWHIDLKQTSLVDGTKVYICIVLDDYSRYALAAVLGPEKTTEWTAEAIHRPSRKPAPQTRSSPTTVVNLSRSGKSA